jgi:hypothetical protein
VLTKPFKTGAGRLIIVLMLCLGLSLTISTYARSDTTISILDVLIPDYEVTTEEGVDYVEIPEGKIATVIGKPAVPYYTVHQDYPKGYVVQGVVLLERSGLETATGLRIPDYIPMADIPDAGEPNGDGDEGWFPDLESEFDWAVDENPDGSTTLVIAIFPFYYNTETTDVIFYKNYSFRIGYILSTIQITKLALDKAVYDPSDNVNLDLEVTNPGEAQDIVVSVVIRMGDTDEIVDGLPLRKLKGLQGQASFTTQWDSTGFKPGYHRIDIEIRDDSSNILDRGLTYFTLGTIWGKTTSFTVTPQHFNVGDKIDMSLAFENAGSIEISGACLIQVQNETGEIVKEFNHEFDNLAPGRSLTFTEVWDTYGGKEGAFRIYGYVLYDGEITPPVTTIVSTNYFPVAELYYVPESPDINQDVTYDASNSSDADGKIASFDWDFGDGCSATGKIVIHRYQEYGEYEVTLTIADNEGAIDTTTGFVVVRAPAVIDKGFRWDINEDGIVDYLDLAILGAHYGEITESPFPRYDINADGRVGLDDRDILVFHYGEGCTYEDGE